MSTSLISSLRLAPSNGKLSPPERVGGLLSKLKSGLLSKLKKNREERGAHAEHAPGEKSAWNEKRSSPVGTYGPAVLYGLLSKLKTPQSYLHIEVNQK